MKINFLQVRLNSQCLYVFLLSDDIEFLEQFGEASLNARLVVWETRFIILSDIDRTALKELMVSSWTYSHMNTIFSIKEPSKTSK